ncbi:MAG: hypothetical protein HY903_20585 [Deltaproteobacteria bacterium]|nr:hypothetical protein [Deltaproteobacteria bacterium]
MCDSIEVVSSRMRQRLPGTGALALAVVTSLAACKSTTYTAVVAPREHAWNADECFIDCLRADAGEARADCLLTCPDLQVFVDERCRRLRLDDDAACAEAVDRHVSAVKTVLLVTGVTLGVVALGVLASLDQR